MKNRALIIQRLVSNYRILANECLVSEYSEIREEGEKYLAKSEKLAEQINPETNVNPNQ